MWDLTVAQDHDFYVAITSGGRALVHNCPMLGEGGTQLQGSRTLRTDDGQGYRVDVENPAPGVREGNLHLQFGGTCSPKWYYDFATGNWVPGKNAGLLSGRQLKQINNDPGVQRAISRELGFLMSNNISDAEGWHLVFNPSSWTVTFIDGSVVDIRANAAADREDTLSFLIWLEPRDAPGAGAPMTGYEFVSFPKAIVKTWEGG